MGIVTDQRMLDELIRCERGVTEEVFRKMPERDVIRCLDVMAQAGGGHDRTEADYRNELTRRAAERQGRRLEVLTVVIAVLTAALIALELGPRIVGAGH